MGSETMEFFNNEVLTLMGRNLVLAVEVRDGETLQKAKELKILPFEGGRDVGETTEKILEWMRREASTIPQASIHSVKNEFAIRALSMTHVNALIPLWFMEGCWVAELRKAGITEVVNFWMLGPPHAEDQAQLYRYSIL